MTIRRLLELAEEELALLTAAGHQSFYVTACLQMPPLMFRLEVGRQVDGYPGPKCSVLKHVNELVGDGHEEKVAQMVRDGVQALLTWT